MAVPGFNHFWSLAVEEQFYLLWPAVIWLVPDRKRMVQIAVGMVVLAPLIRAGIWIFDLPVLGTYVLTPSRMDSLAMGSLVFFLMQKHGVAARVEGASKMIFAVCALAVAILFSVSGTSSMSLPVSIAGFSLLSLLFSAVLTITISAKPSVIKAICNHAVLRAAGKYSYAMYILHPSVRRVLLDKITPHISIPTLFGSDLPRQIFVYAVGFGATFVLALISWYVIESHFIKLKDRFPSASPRF